MSTHGYQEIRVMYPMREGEEVLPEGLTVHMEGNAAKAFRAIIDYGSVVEMAGVESGGHHDTVMSELKSVNVWFNPKTDFNLRQNTPVIIDSRMVGAFEDILQASTPIDSDTLRKKFNPKAWVNSHCRAQIFSQTATTDIRTAEVIANYFRAVEDSDFTAMESMLAPDVTCRVPENFYDFGETRTREHYLAQLIPFRKQYKELWFDVTWAYVQSTRAVIEFCLWSDNKVVCSGLTQYSFEIVDNVPLIYSIYSHSRSTDGSVLAAEDGTLQWTQQANV
jgi:ketosteroid isomerase-like protein